MGVKGACPVERSYPARCTGPLNSHAHEAALNMSRVSQPVQQLITIVLVRIERFKQLLVPVDGGPARPDARSEEERRELLREIAAGGEYPLLLDDPPASLFKLPELVVSCAGRLRSSCLT